MNLFSSGHIGFTATNNPPTSESEDFRHEGTSQNSRVHSQMHAWARPRPSVVDICLAGECLSKGSGEVLLLPM